MNDSFSIFLSFREFLQGSTPTYAGFGDYIEIPQATL